MTNKMLVSILIPIILYLLMGFITWDITWFVFDSTIGRVWVVYYVSICLYFSWGYAMFKGIK